MLWVSSVIVHVGLPCKSGTLLWGESVGCEACHGGLGSRTKASAPVTAASTPSKAHLFRVSDIVRILEAEDFTPAGAGRTDRGAGGGGLMFGIWVLTLHLPRVLGFLGGGGLRDPDEWSSRLIAMAIWGGAWADIKGTKEKFPKSVGH
jgi:hypothetical protein